MSPFIVIRIRDCDDVADPERKLRLHETCWFHWSDVIPVEQYKTTSIFIGV